MSKIKTMLMKNLPLLSREKIQTGKWTKIFCMSLFLMGFASCIDGFKDEETFSPGVTNTQLESPDPTKITVVTVTNTDGGEELKISWPVVYGAGGYQFTLYNVDDPDNPVIVGEEDQFVDGCSAQRPKQEDTKYEIVILTLGNEKYNNKTAITPTEVAYNTLLPATLIPDGTNLTTYFAENPIPETKEEIGYQLEAGGNYILDGDIDLKLTTLTIRGDKVNHAKITMKGTGGLVIGGGGLKIKFIDFVFDNFTGNGILKCKSPIDPTLSLYGGAAIIFNPVAFQSCNIQDLPRPLVYNPSLSYAFSSITINDCLVSISDRSQILISLGGSSGWVKDLMFQNSTVYYKEPGMTYLVQMRTRNVTNFGGSGWGSASVKMLNCTFYQIGNADKRFFNNVVQSQASLTVTIQKTIFADCTVQAGSTESAEGVLRQLNNNAANANYSFSQNTYYYSYIPGGFLADDTSAGNGRDKSGTAINVNPDFEDPANGNFRPRGVTQLSNRTGDPRWLPSTE